METAERLLGTAPTVALRRELAELYTGFGKLRSAEAAAVHKAEAAEHFREAKNNLLKALEIRDALAREIPEPLFRRELAGAYGDLAGICADIWNLNVPRGRYGRHYGEKVERSTGEIEEGLTWWRKCIAILEDIVEETGTAQSLRDLTAAGRGMSRMLEDQIKVEEERANAEWRGKFNSVHDMFSKELNTEWEKKIADTKRKIYSEAVRLEEKTVKALERLFREIGTYELYREVKESYSRTCVAYQNLGDSEKTEEYVYRQFNFDGDGLGNLYSKEEFRQPQIQRLMENKADWYTMRASEKESPFETRKWALKQAMQLWRCLYCYVPEEPRYKKNYEEALEQAEAFPKVYEAEREEAAAEGGSAEGAAGKKGAAAAGALSEKTETSETADELPMTEMMRLFEILGGEGQDSVSSEVRRDLARHLDEQRKQAIKQKKPKRAKELCPECMKLWEEIAEQTGAAADRRELAEVYRIMGNYACLNDDLDVQEAQYTKENCDAALDYYQKGLELYLTAPQEALTKEDRFAMGSFYTSLGILYNMNGEREAEKQCCEKAYDLYLTMTSESPKGWGELQNFCATYGALLAFSDYFKGIHAAGEEKERAQMLFQEAIRIGEEHGSDPGVNAVGNRPSDLRGMYTKYWPGEEV